MNYLYTFLILFCLPSNAVKRVGTSKKSKQIFTISKYRSSGAGHLQNFLPNITFLWNENKNVLPLRGKILDRIGF